MAHVDPDQEAALRRLRAAFGFVEVLAIIDHQRVEDSAGEPEPQDGEHDDQAPPAGNE